jgi:hypothetical protein
MQMFLLLAAPRLYGSGDELVLLQPPGSAVSAGRTDVWGICSTKQDNTACGVQCSTVGATEHPLRVHGKSDKMLADQAHTKTPGAFVSVLHPPWHKQLRKSAPG